jgi:uncharacterized protein (DUF58 family)
MSTFAPADAQHEALRYLQPEVLGRLENLELVAKFIVEGLIIGLHRSPYHGFSVEFSSYRKYTPGDDIKFVDWRVFARTDRFYIKQFEETTNLNCYLVTDFSGSMAMPGTGGVTKIDYARYLAAGLAYLMLGQGDAVALLAASAEQMEFIPPSGRGTQLVTLLTELARQKPRGETVLTDALQLLADRIKGRGMVILLSDLLLDTDRLESTLSYFRYRNHEIVLFHILNDLEREFPFTNVTSFRDLETGREVFTEPATIRRQYLELLDEHTERIRSKCHDMEIDFVPLTTTQPLGTALLAYLARRQSAL